LTGVLVLLLLAILLLFMLEQHLICFISSCTGG
jgi:hypothetical protein